MVERFIITASSMATPCRLLVVHVPVVPQGSHAQGLEVPHHQREPPPVEAKRQADPVPKRSRARRGHVPPGPGQLKREAPAAEPVHLPAAETVEARKVPLHGQLGSTSPQTPNHLDCEYQVNPQPIASYIHQQRAPNQRNNAATILWLKDLLLHASSMAKPRYSQ